MRTVSSLLIRLSRPNVFDRSGMSPMPTSEEEDTMRANHRTTRAVALAAAAIACTLAACGSDVQESGSGDGVASLRDDGAPSASSSDTASTSDDELEAPDDPEEAFSLFNECLEEHGIDPGEGFMVGDGEAAIAVAPAGGAAGEGPSDQMFVAGEGPDGSLPEIDEEFLEANEACRGHLANATPDFDLTPEQEAAMEDAQLAFQQCMTEHGIEGGGFSIAVGDGAALDVQEAPDADVAPTPREIDPDEFQAAAEECQSVYDDYPELDDVFGDGPGGGVFVGRTEAGPAAEGGE
jgi:hypothetical protein